MEPDCGCGSRKGQEEPSESDGCLGRLRVRSKYSAIFVLQQEDARLEGFPRITFHFSVYIFQV